MRVQDGQLLAPFLGSLRHWLLRGPAGCPRRESKANSQSRSSSKLTSVITRLYANPGPTLIVGLEHRAPMSARAVAVIRPAPSIISLPAFLYILSGKRQLHAYQYRSARCPLDYFRITVDTRTGSPPLPALPGPPALVCLLANPTLTAGCLAHRRT